MIDRAELGTLVALGLATEECRSYRQVKVHFSSQHPSPVHDQNLFYVIRFITDLLISYSTTGGIIKSPYKAIRRPISLQSRSCTIVTI